MIETMEVTHRPPMAYEGRVAPWIGIEPILLPDDVITFRSAYTSDTGGVVIDALPGGSTWVRVVGSTLPIVVSAANVDSVVRGELTWRRPVAA